MGNDKDDKEIIVSKDADKLLNLMDDDVKASEVTVQRSTQRSRS